MERQFGDAVKVEYQDAMEPNVQDEFSAVLELAKDKDWPYPLVLMNGSPIIAGSAEYYQIAPVLAKTLHL